MPACLHAFFALGMPDARVHRVSHCGKKLRVSVTVAPVQKRRREKGAHLELHSVSFESRFARNAASRDLCVSGFLGALVLSVSMLLTKMRLWYGVRLVVDGILRFNLRFWKNALLRLCVYMRGFAAGLLWLGYRLGQIFYCSSNQ